MDQLGIFFNTNLNQNDNVHILEPLSAGANIKLVEKAAPDAVKGTASVSLDEICLKLNYSQFRTMIKFQQKLEKIRRKNAFTNYRPKVPKKGNPRPWWKFAFKTVLKQYHIDERIKLFNREYIQGKERNIKSR